MQGAEKQNKSSKRAWKLHKFLLVLFQNIKLLQLNLTFQEYTGYFNHLYIHVCHNIKIRTEFVESNWLGDPVQSYQTQGFLLLHPKPKQQFQEVWKLKKKKKTRQKRRRRRRSKYLKLFFRIFLDTKAGKNTPVVTIVMVNMFVWFWCIRLSSKKLALFKLVVSVDVMQFLLLHTRAKQTGSIEGTNLSSSLDSSANQSDFDRARALQPPVAKSIEISTSTDSGRLAEFFFSVICDSPLKI